MAINKLDMANLAKEKGCIIKGDYYFNGKGYSHEYTVLKDNVVIKKSSSKKEIMNCLKLL